jgi:hypothetical protein
MVRIHHLDGVGRLTCGSYTGHDPIGVELAGAIKNVVAIAAGVADGLGFENNTRASKPKATSVILMSKVTQQC